MDAIDLLLLASTSIPVERASVNSNVDSTEGGTDKSTKITDSDTEAVDAILALRQKFSNPHHEKAEGAEPLHQKRQRFNTLNSISENEDEPLPKNFRRPRAMSEPWSSSNPYNWVNKSNSPPPITHSIDDLHSNPTSLIANFFDKYSSIYNKNGRIGIYTKEERSAIISKYREKRKKRNWKKQIRYFCRKNLADRRIRVRGRFVKMEEMPKDVLEEGNHHHHQLFEEGEDDYEDEEEDQLAMDVEPKPNLNGRAGRKRSNSVTSVGSSSISTNQLPKLTGEPLSIHLRSPSSTPKSGTSLTINLSQIRSKRDRYNGSFKEEAVQGNNNSSSSNGNIQEVGILGNTNENKLSFLVDALNGMSESNQIDFQDPPGKRLRRHSIAY